LAGTIADSELSPAGGHGVTCREPQIAETIVRAKQDARSRIADKEVQIPNAVTEETKTQARSAPAVSPVWMAHFVLRNSRLKQLIDRHGLVLNGEPAFTIGAIAFTS
jgi:hypothetical protein